MAFVVCGTRTAQACTAVTSLGGIVFKRLCIIKIRKE